MPQIPFGAPGVPLPPGASKSAISFAEDYWKRGLSARPADRLAEGFGTGLTRPGGASRGGVPAFSAAFNPPVVKDASYYMQQAAELYPGIDFSGLRDRAQTSVSETDARVKAMYKAMREIQAEEAANRDASRSAAGESIAQSADKAAADIAQGYDNAIKALSSEMTALGLAETLAQEPAQRTAAESGRQQAISRQIGQISGNLNTELGQADSAYNQQIRDVTGLEGVDFRSQLQKDLLNQLANYDMAEQQQNQDLALKRLQYAQGLRGYEQSFEPQGLSVSEQLEAQRIANDASQSLAQRQDAMFQFFMDKKGMDPATAAQAVNDYFAGANQ